MHLFWVTVTMFFQEWLVASLVGRSQVGSRGMAYSRFWADVKGCQRDVNAPKKDPSKELRGKIPPEVMGEISARFGKHIN